MSDKKRIGVLAGSLRKVSFSKSIARAVMSMTPDDLDMTFIDLEGLPIYNQDFDDEGAVPQSWEQFRSEIGNCDGFIFVTPEYNRSIPPVMKNALDIASRPYGHNAWAGKPSGVISVSPGTFGAFGANHILRQSMVFLDVPMMQQPEMYIRGVGDMIDADGNLTDTSAASHIKKFVEAYDEWISIFEKGRN